MAYDIQLKTLQQKIIRKRELTNALGLLSSQQKEVSARLISLEEAMQHSRIEIEKLEKGGLYTLFHTITGKKESKLESERQQVEDLTVQYARLSSDFNTIERQLEVKGIELSTLEGYEEKFEKLLEAKRREIEQLQIPVEEKIRAKEQELAMLKEHAVLFEDAIKLSDTLLEQIQQVQETLNEAEKVAISQREVRKAELIRQAQAQVSVLKAGVQNFVNRTRQLFGVTSIKVNLDEVYEICSGIYTSYVASNMVLDVAEIERIRTTKGNVWLLKEKLDSITPQLFTEQESNKKKRAIVQEQIENLIIEA